MQTGEAVDAFVAGYFSTCKRSSKTQAAYHGDLEQLRTFIGPAVTLGDIEPSRLEAWAAQLQSEQYAPGSIRRKFATARVFFGYWVRRGVLEKSPLWRLRLDLGRDRVLPRSLSPGDSKRFIEEAWRQVPSSTSVVQKKIDRRFLRLRNIAALEILFATGMRVGELVKLSLTNWHDDERSFLVLGKGSRQRLAFLPDERSLKAAQMYMTQRRTLDVGHEYIFVNAAGRQLSAQGVSRIVRETGRAAGIEKKVTPHMIRHTVATLLLRYGADIRIVQEVLGHASIATTQRYTHVSKDHLFSALLARHPNAHLDISWPPELRTLPGHNSETALR